MTFFGRLRERIRTTGGVLAVGLNPEPSRLPDDSRTHDYPRRAFNRRLVDATHDEAAVYVLNPAFYADAGGWTALAETVAYAQGRSVPVVLDGKWSEVPNPAARLLDSVDAVTVSPYCGREAVEPALDSDLGVFVVCRTPNAGAGDLQDRELAVDERQSAGDGEESVADEENPAGDGEDSEGETLAERVASLTATWAEDATADGSTADVGLLVGGESEQVEALRKRAPNLPFLAVGGARNDPEVAEFVAPDEGPNEEIGLVETSREVAYAGESAGRGRARGQDDYATAAGQAARRLKSQLNRHR